MPKKDETAEKAAHVKFVQLVTAGDALYALDDQSRVFVYDERDKGWFQIDGDDVRETLQEEDPE
jgi:hypothetical protein